MSFVSQSEIVVPLAERANLERAFAERAKIVDRHEGFRGLELLRNVREHGRYVLVLRWRSRADFLAYMQSGDHERAHARPHAGLAIDTLHGAKLDQFESVDLSDVIREPVQS